MQHSPSSSPRPPLRPASSLRLLSTDGGLQEYAHQWRANSSAGLAPATVSFTSYEVFLSQVFHGDSKDRVLAVVRHLPVPAAFGPEHLEILAIALQLEHMDDIVPARTVHSQADYAAVFSGASPRLLGQLGSYIVPGLPAEQHWLTMATLTVFYAQAMKARLPDMLRAAQPAHAHAAAHQAAVVAAAHRMALEVHVHEHRIN